ncbi:class A beta-lactamase-related serine hydrolase [Ornithobacterium rhinotracheale]|uniref:Class A beta-lactamase-related serine hydrolase n=1 Tax=Ornithobacterium rhinotracheale TaxID=28251 RepID=A0A3R5YV68_ORNRH|nr:serine hydrolase domain-containing protein [Ornithobacterium rhinotracheale]QAR30298.1 class A beta-lactamase-related serine hydrolase [Ornithobacterium rhinotracheale]
MRLIVFTLCATLLFACSAKTDAPVLNDSSQGVSYPTFEKPLVNLPYNPSNLAKFKQEKQPYLQAFFRDYWEANQVSAGLLVAKNGEIIFEKYLGQADKAANEDLMQDTPIHLASISKVLTAVAILRLVQAGKLKLEQPVYSLLPAFPYKEVTVRDLLTHRSGLQNYAYFKPHKKFWREGKMKTNYDVLEYLANGLSQTYSLPNKNFSYCNTNYALLALIIEKVTGERYPIAMQKMVFEPFGMNHTFVFDYKNPREVSKSYTFKGELWPESDLDAICGDKNIYSTPRDILQLDRAMYADNFLTPELKKLMKQGYSNERRGVKNYGLGIRMMQWDSGEKLLYHNGWWHGNYTTYVRGEQDTISIIALGNQRNRSVYSAFSLAGILGKYPVGLEKIKNTHSLNENPNDTINLQAE